MRSLPHLRPSFLVALVLTFWSHAGAGSQPRADVPIVVDDFEGDSAGALPGRWKYFSHRQRAYLSLDQVMDEKEKFFVVEERGNKFLRGYTEDEALRITIPNEKDTYHWDLRRHTRLRWDWRAMQLPQGADERKANDTGGALYVTFSTDWLGRPRSIKYTYSSTLPVGTIVDYGRLQVIVASSGADGLDHWITVERDVVADYRQVFGNDPPDRPLLITLWSDSDNTNGVAEVDFDNIVLLPARH